ncbi:MAG: sulfatase-like hydrolase/transferase [Terriglobia bacterium]
MEKLSRREFLSTGVAATAGSVAVPGGSSRSSARAFDRPPNVLLIMSDQHTRNALGVAGNPVAHTPNLDALARSGVRFDDAYCTLPVCVASRASLLSGLYPHHHRAYNNAQPWPFSVKTLAHYLGRAGYMTGVIGKMHFVDAQTHGFDYKLDFNDWHQYLGPKTKLVAEEIIDPNSGSGLPQIDDLWRESGDPWTGFIERDNRQGYTSVGRISALAEEDHFETFVARESMRFLRNHGKEQPFFLISSFLKPHDPFTPAERFAKMFQPPEMKLPETWGEVDLATVPQWIQSRIHYDGSCPELRFPDAARLHIALYYASLAQMDDNVGKLMGTLSELGLNENTIVLYTSDHGEMLGEHGLWQKFVFYEPSVGMPLIFRVPGVTPSNARCATPVSLVQMVPTLLELCGVPIPAGLDGASIARLLREPGAEIDSTVFAELALKTQHPGAMIRQGRYKYSYYVGDMDELYDLVADPAEMKNLAALPAYRQKRDELKKQLFAWHNLEKEVG